MIHWCPTVTAFCQRSPADGGAPLTCGAKGKKQEQFSKTDLPSCQEIFCRCKPDGVDPDESRGVARVVVSLHVHTVKKSKQRFERQEKKPKECCAKHKSIKQLIEMLDNTSDSSI